MILFKIVLLQVFWFVTVFYNNGDYWPLILLASFILALLNFKIYKSGISLSRYIVYLSFFILWGLVQDSYLVKQEVLLTDEHPYWLISLWVIFICYYGDILNKISKLSLPLLAFLGGLGGAFAYYSGAQLSEMQIAVGREFEYIFIVAISWAIFFPLTIKEFYMGKLWDYIMDKSVIFSFDRSGYIRHSNSFEENLVDYDLSQRRALVTGGTSGIGRSVAQTLASSGARVIITGRNLQRANQITQKYPNIKFQALDLTNWDKIEKIEVDQPLDYLVLNAGGMPEQYLTNKEGVEFQAASQLIGHYKLMKYLKDKEMINKETRIVWVSSGGMYLKELDLNHLFTTDNYEKVAAYANVKRAQVTLVEDLVLSDEWKHWSIFSMHPGWVKTGGLDDALPGFVSLMNKRLRSSDQGADTINWLCLTRSTPDKGGFYFDRKKVSPYISKKYIPKVELRSELIRKVLSF